MNSTSDRLHLQPEGSIPPPSSVGLSTGSPNTNTTSFPPTRPHDCRRPRLIAQRDGAVEWLRCGRPRCSHGCRAIWAWKHSQAVIRSVQVYKRTPTLFMTLIRLQGVMPTEREFSGAVSRFFEILKRKVPGLEYLWVNEWAKKSGVRHAHALLMTPSKLGGLLLRDVAKRAAIRVRSCRPIRRLIGAVNYLFKHTRNDSKKPRLPPSSFRGRIFTASRGFLAKPIMTLWREYRESRYQSAQMNISHKA